jgi:hypothetical protein
MDRLNRDFWAETQRVIVCKALEIVVWAGLIMPRLCIHTMRSAET